VEVAAESAQLRWAGGLDVANPLIQLGTSRRTGGGTLALRQLSTNRLTVRLLPR
jgi:hypothetical protein